MRAAATFTYGGRAEHRRSVIQTSIFSATSSGSTPRYRTVLPILVCEEQLDGPQVCGTPIDQRCLGAARPVRGLFQFSSLIKPTLR